MSVNSVKSKWTRHWKEKITLEDSSSYYGRWLRRKRLELLKEIFKKYSRSLSVIDIGCGGGDTLRIFKNLGFKNLIGIDFAEDSIAHCEKLGFIRDKELFVMDAKHTTFPDNSFDIVFSEGLWEHFADPRPYMLEAIRISKKYIIVIQPNHYSFFGKLMQLGWKQFSKSKGGVEELSFLLSYFREFLKIYSFRLVETKSTLIREQVIMIFKKVEEDWYYNIHDFFKLASNRELPKLSCFKMPKLNDIDIIIKFGNFIPELSQMQKIHSYWVGDHSLYYKGRHKSSFWKIWIEHLDFPVTVIHFHGDPLFSKEIFFVLLLEPFLTYKLSQKGILMLHSSALTINDKGIVISGETGAGKTTMLLNLLNQSNTEYFADDQSIVKGSTLYSYPMPIGLRSHLVHNCKLKLQFKDNLYILFHNLVNILTGYYGNLTHRVYPEEIHFKNSKNSIKTGDKVNIKYVFILSLSNKSKIKKLTPGEALSKLLHHNRGNEDKQKIINRFLTAYKAVYPEFSYRKDFEKILTEFVHSDINFYEVQLSKKYRIKENISKIVKILEGEE